MEKKKLKIGLAGNPNSGKSTLFNELTGGHQHVGNWPGVTVEKKEGRFQFGDFEVTVLDLPGIYSLTAHSIDERIARDFIVQEKPDKIVVIIDAGNIERSLYLVTQLLELGVNVILDLNMMDRVRNKGMMIDIEKLSKVLGVAVVETVANKGEGIEKVKEAIVDSVKKEKEFFKIDYGEDIETEIQQIEKRINISGYPSRWIAIKLLEGDMEILKMAIKESKEIEFHSIECRKKLEEHLGYDLETAIVERRYAFLSGLVKESVKKKFHLMEQLEISDRIDKILLNRYLGIPIFLCLMWLVFQFVFSLGNPFAHEIDAGIRWFGEFTSSGIERLGGSKWFSSFFSDGIISGVGSVLVFLPNIMLLFFAIAVLEASGYMARAAFIMDRFMHSLGLHGKSFIPMLMGFGCNIPGILATRTLESEKDRILTILILPLMSCSARLPIYTLFAGAFFPKYQGWIVFSLYLMGLILSVLIARIFKSIFFAKKIAPLIMELPPYRLPSLKGIIIHMWERSRLFLKKAGTIIFACVIFIWLLASLPFGVEYASEESLIGKLGSFFAPLLKPCGFGFSEVSIALFFGIIAKEVVVGTLGTLYGVAENGLTNVIQSVFTPLSAYAFMAMSLVYIPCISAVATIKRETNIKWAFLAVSYSLILGWLLAALIYQIGKIFF